MEATFSAKGTQLGWYKSRRVAIKFLKLRNIDLSRSVKKELKTVSRSRERVDLSDGHMDHSVGRLKAVAEFLTFVTSLFLFAFSYDGMQNSLLFILEITAICLYFLNKCHTA